MGIMKDDGIFFRSAYIDQEPVQFLHDSFCSLKILLNEVCALPTENLKISSLHNELVVGQKFPKHRLIFFLI